MLVTKPVVVSSPAKDAITLSDSDLICCDDIASSWRARLECTDAQMQTLPLQCKDQQSQVCVRVDAGAQTESTHASTVDSAAFSAAASQPLPAELSQFILSVAPSILTQLELNCTSRAFDEYTGSAGGMAASRSTEQTITQGPDAQQYELLFALTTQPSATVAEPVTKAVKPKSKAQTQSEDEDASLLTTSASPNLSCVSVTWNASGSLLVCIFAHSISSHVGWCTHSASTDASQLTVWNTMKRNLNQSSPDSSIELAACGTVAAAHPQLPHLVVVGLITGELRLYDVNKMEASDDSTTAAAAVSPANEPLLAASVIDDLRHRDCITSLVWLPSSNSHKDFTRLASLSIDGKLLVWTVLTPSGTLSTSGLMHPTRDCRVLRPTVQYHGLSPSLSQSLFPYYGGSALDFDCNNGSYVVGTECGGLVRARMTSHPSLNQPLVQPMQSGEWTWSSEAVQVVSDSPSAAELKRHVESHCKLRAVKGQIQLKNVFDSAPLSSMIYPTLQSNSLPALEGCQGASVNAIACNRFDGRLCAVVSSASHCVQVYNTASSSVSPLLQLEVNLSASLSGSKRAVATHAVALLDVQWSPVCALVMAVSTSHGEVHVFDLLQSVRSAALIIQCNPQGRAVTAVRFNDGSSGSSNSSSAEIMASCDALGRAQVWRLPLQLCQMRARELQTLQRIIQSGLTSDAQTSTR